MRKKYALLFLFLFLFPTLILAEETVISKFVNIPKNIKDNDIITVPVKYLLNEDCNITVENEYYNIEKFWLAYFNSKENNIENSKLYEGDEFSFNIDKKIFNLITNKKYLLWDIDIQDDFPEYNFKGNYFSFSDEYFFPASGHKDSSGTLKLINRLTMTSPIKIKVSANDAKHLKFIEKKCRLQVLYQIIGPVKVSFNEICYSVNGDRKSVV